MPIRKCRFTPTHFGLEPRLLAEIINPASGNITRGRLYVGDVLLGVHGFLDKFRLTIDYLKKHFTICRSRVPKRKIKPTDP